MQYLKDALKNFVSRWPLLIICFFIVSGIWYLTFNHYKRFGIEQDLITSLETRLLDFRFLTRGIKKPKSRTGILAIDEKTLKKFGQWPISRHYYEKALLNLKELGVAWVGFDAIFSENQKALISDAEELLTPLKDLSNHRLKDGVIKAISQIEAFSKESPEDRTFSSGIKQFGNVVLGFFYLLHKSEVALSGRTDNPFAGLDSMLSSEIQAISLPEGKELKDYPDAINAYGIVANIPAISNASTYFAFFSNEADHDAIVRWVTLVRIINGHLMPSLSLKLAAESMNRDILATFDQVGLASIELVSRENGTDSISIPLDPLGQGRMLANYRGPGMTFPHFSLADAYDNTFTEQQKKHLKGATLLLGMTATGINDQRPNPFDPTFDGVEIHATVVDNIKNQDFIRRPATIYSTELLILILIAIIFVPLLIISRPIYSALAVGSFAIGYYYFDRIYWFDHGIWAYMGVPMIEILILSMVVTLYKYIIEEREKHKVKGAFSHYLSPEVINQVLEDPGSLQLGGVRKELTVFFSDVRGFTTISESLTPEQLCLFMNEYFTPMTEIILKSKGVLDKYIGDAIMAFWGAPIAIENQSEVAADAALAMLSALRKLQHDFKMKGLPTLDIGMGLNTGPMSVGNMGSDERFCYTVMGDAVNLGSRLESLTKEYGIRAMISETTVAGFKSKRHYIRDLDDIRVKGKNEPIKVFHLLHPMDFKKEQDLINLIGEFERGRQFYRAKNWEQASFQFNECLKIVTDDGPSLLYLERIAEYKTEPPPENWDGVFTFHHK